MRFLPVEREDEGIFDKVSGIGGVSRAYCVLLSTGGRKEKGNSGISTRQQYVSRQIKRNISRENRVRGKK